MAETKVSHRIFAFLLAGLFFLSACTLTIFVIYDMVNSKKTAGDSAAQQQAAAEQACSISTPVTGMETLPAPEEYTVPDPVTELKTEDLAPADGQAAKAGDCLVVKYYGTLAKDGKKFDENFTQPTALQFQVGQGQVIKGWDDGLIGMKVGSTRRVTIPAAQAYGDQSPSPDIPANSDLVFVVKLEKIKS